jgi:hypothetical protein
VKPRPFLVHVSPRVLTPEDFIRLGLEKCQSKGCTTFTSTPYCPRHEMDEAIKEAVRCHELRRHREEARSVIMAGVWGAVITLAIYGVWWICH